MAAVAKRGVKPLLPRLDLKEIEDFLYTDRDMHPSRRTSLAHHLRHGIGVFLRLKLLIFFLIISRMSPFIPDPAFMCLLLILHLFLPLSSYSLIKTAAPAPLSGLNPRFSRIQNRPVLRAV